MFFTNANAVLSRKQAKLGSYNYLRASYAASRYCFWRRLSICLSVCASVCLQKISKTTGWKLM